MGKDEEKGGAKNEANTNSRAYVKASKRAAEAKIDERTDEGQRSQRRERENKQREYGWRQRRDEQVTADTAEEAEVWNRRRLGDGSPRHPAAQDAKGNGQHNEANEQADVSRVEKGGWWLASQIEHGC